MSEGLFVGLKVIDCASFVAAPAAATLMSGFGADVIKLCGSALPPRQPREKVSNACVPELVAVFDEKLAQRDFSEWRVALHQAGIDVGDDPQTRTVGPLVPLANEPDLLTVNSPFELDGIDKTRPGAVPGLEEHSAEILREAGFVDGEIKCLRDLQTIV